MRIKKKWSQISFLSHALLKSSQLQVSCLCHTRLCHAGPNILQGLAATHLACQSTVEKEK